MTSLSAYFASGKRKGNPKVPKLTNRFANLRRANPNRPTERCANCVFFRGPKTCKVVVGPVGPNLVCDWIQRRGKRGEGPSYKVSDKDLVAFTRGMIKRQPYQHIVINGAWTPVGFLVLIEDTATPPHRFSLTRDFHIQHTSLEHNWGQAEVDKLIQIGRRS